MGDTRGKHWRNASEDGDGKKKIHNLRWEVYVKDKEELINRELLVSIPHTKGGKYFWTCVKDHIIEENDGYEAIGLRGFDYILFE